MKVYEHLQKLEKLPFKSILYTDGICLWMDTAPMAQQEVWLKHSQQCFRSWEYFSGDRWYPVPHTTGAGTEYINTTFKWNRFSEYGKLRRDLLKHCIKWFKERDL